MNYPLISEYIEAIKLAEDNFDQLSSLRPVLDSYGNPIMSSGNFAVVFKMKDINTGKLHAVKCFIKDQEERNERYALIAAELEQVKSQYILPIHFLEKELFVDTSQSDDAEFPVLVMDWVEGKTLDAYLRENLDNQYRLQVLSYRFCQMSAWLMSQPFAHGDLKPDNILVREDGSLVLVDYDGFYVPSMKGQEARELGSPDFRHPQCTPQDFDEHIDDFSIATIALSLKAISIDAQLYHAYAASDRLLLSANDYHDIGSSKTMQKIMQLASDTELSALLSTFYMASALKVLDKSHIKVFEIEMPAIILGEGKAVLTQEDVKQATEKYGELVHVVIAYSVTEIGIWAFRGCTGLTSVTIPNSVTEIGDSAFRGCSGLTSVTIPNSVTRISDWAFSNCSGLTSATIPNSATEIGEGAFSNCSGLTSVTIPNSVTKIGDVAFSNCSGLTSIIVKNGNSKYDSRNNCNAIIETSTNRLIAGCKNTIIPNSVTEIGNWAFYDCNSLASVTIPNSVTEIGKEVFKGCSGLTSVNIPNSVTEIGDRAFDGCCSLTSVTIPNFVTEIGEGVFNGCSGLTSVTIPNSVTRIGDCAFDGCSGLTSVTIPNSVTKIGYCAFSSCSGLTEVTIPNSVTEIGDRAFDGCCSLTSVTIPNSVTEIGDRAFDGCCSLTSIIVEDGNSKYDSRNNCNAIIETSTNRLIAGCKNSIIPNSVTEIGRYAFYGCSSLTSVTIPNSVIEIGYCAFSRCSGLTSIIVENGNSKYDSRNNCNAIIETSTNRLIAGCKNTIIPNSVIKIDSFAFYGYSSLTSVTIPNSVTRIGSGAFCGCSGLISVTIPNSVTKIGNWAFDGCSSLTSVTLPNSVTEIDSLAFRDCTNLTSVTFSKSITEIGKGVFDRCVNLEEIIISKGYRQKFKKMLREDLYQKLVEQ